MSSKKTPAPTPAAKKSARKNIRLNEAMKQMLMEEARSFLITEVQKIHGETWADAVAKAHNLAPQESQQEKEKIARAFLRGSFAEKARELGMEEATLLEALKPRPKQLTNANMKQMVGPQVRGKAAPVAKPKAKADPTQPVSSQNQMVKLDQILRKSTVKSPVQAAWEIFEANRDERRKDVVAKCLEAGIAFYTARTQYQVWKSAGKAK